MGGYVSNIKKYYESGAVPKGPQPRMGVPLPVPNRPQPRMGVPLPVPNRPQPRMVENVRPQPARPRPHMVKHVHITEDAQAKAKKKAHAKARARAEERAQIKAYAQELTEAEEALEKAQEAEEAEALKKVEEEYEEEYALAEAEEEALEKAEAEEDSLEKAEEEYALAKEALEKAEEEYALAKAEAEAMSELTQVEAMSEDICPIENYSNICYMNIGIIVFLNCAIFNKAVTNYINKNIPLHTISMINNGKNIYEREIYYVKCKYYEFILLSYYEIYKQSLSKPIVKECYAMPFVNFVEALIMKYYPFRKKISNFKSNIDVDLINEVEDNFYKYYKEFMQFKISGGDGQLVLYTLLRLFNIVGRELKDEQKRKDFLPILELFTINGPLKDTLNVNLGDSIKMGPILIIGVMEGVKAMGDYPIYCTKSNTLNKLVKKLKEKEKMSVIHIDEKGKTEEITLIEGKNYFPELLSIKKKKYYLLAKSIMTLPDDEASGLHYELIIRCPRKNVFFRMSNTKVIRCDDINETREIRGTNPNYIKTCKFHNCFDKFVDYVVYVEIS